MREQLSPFQCLLRISCSHCEIQSRPLCVTPLVSRYVKNGVGIISSLLPCSLPTLQCPGWVLKALQSQESTFHPHPNDADGNRRLPEAGLLWSRATQDVGSASQTFHRAQSIQLISVKILHWVRRQERGFCSSQVCSRAESV